MPGIKYSIPSRKSSLLPNIYRLDDKATRDDDLHEYKTIFQDAGWEYVTRYGDWHYIRTEESPGQTAEIDTEREYQIEKYSGLLLLQPG